MKENRKTVTLLLGGVRSGKSRLALDLASRGCPVTFLATAQPFDDEMRLKIKRHQEERPPTWETVEVPVDLDLAVRKHGSSGRFVIVDCLTLFAANIMELEKENLQAMLQRVDRLCLAIAASAASMVFVSNEVGSGVVPAFASGRMFRDLLGEMNQKVARIADDVLLVVAGLPLVLKGKHDFGS